MIELSSPFNVSSGIEGTSRIEGTNSLKSLLEGGRRSRRRRGGGASFPSSLSRLLKTGGFY